MPDHVVTPVVPKKIQSCSKCNGPMSCDLQQGKSVCWCFHEEPLINKSDEYEGCLCRSCLRLENDKGK